MAYALMAAGAVMGGLGAAQQSQAQQTQLKGQENTLKTQQTAYEMKAQGFDERAIAARQLAEVQEAIGGMKGREQQATAVAQMGHSGVAVGGGSNLALEMKNARMADYNSRLAGYDARMQDWNSKQEAWSARYGATVAETERKNVRRTRGWVSDMMPMSIATGMIGGALGMGGGSMFGGGGSGEVSSVPTSSIMAA